MDDGGFSQYLYEAVTPAVVVNGVKGRIVKSVFVEAGGHDSLPTYSNSSDIYFKQNEIGVVIQAKVYRERKMILDFDWDHTHKNADGTMFEKGTIHVQSYMIKKDGSFKRLSGKARRMTSAEIEKYGPIIRHFNSNVKF